MPLTTRNKNSEKSRLLQRKCACAGACNCSKKKKRHGTLQRSGSGKTGEAPQIVHDVLSSPGRPLEPSTRELMESRIGHSFERVRIHTDERAAESANSVDSRAYSVGQHVVFGSGQFAPADHGGQQLLAHELTHSLQQQPHYGNSPPDTITIDSPNSEMERQAEAVALGATFRTSNHPVSPRIQRAPKASDGQSSLHGCAGKKMASAKADLKTKLDLLPFLSDQESAVRSIFLALKRTRACFPLFVESNFLSLSKTKKMLNESVRKAVASRHPKSLREDDRKLIWAESKKPFAGYSASGFEAVRRFSSSRNKKLLGFDNAVGHQKASEFANRTADDAKKAFKGADVLMFSGHQYAQYKAPGVWKDAGKAGWDLRKVEGPLPQVKLIISTSCATICREAASVWKSIFPNAVVLGYKRSAPLAGGAVANSFVDQLPDDLLLEGRGVSQAISAWKATVARVHKGNNSRQPGWLNVSSGQVEYWNGKTWVSVSADSDANKCRVKGDYSADWPDPRRGAGP